VGKGNQERCRGVERRLRMENSCQEQLTEMDGR